MKTTHTFGIQFIIRTGKKDKGLVYARITVETRRIEISLKKTIAVEEWNKARGMARGSKPEAKKFNSYLEQVRAQLTDAYHKLQVSKEKITPENIKALFLGDSDEHTLMELVDYHNTTQTSVLSPGTMKNIKQMVEIAEALLNIKLTNYYNDWKEMRGRTKSRVPFLERMIKHLLRRMDNADEK